MIEQAADFVETPSDKAVSKCVHARGVIADILARLDERARVRLPVISQVAGGDLSPNLELLRDVQLNARIELGRARMTLAEVLRLGEGSVVPLNKPADDPVDVYVNDRLIARGQVMVHEDKLCVRISEIVSE